MLTFRVGSGELNVQITFKENEITPKDAALEVLREAGTTQLGDVLVVELCKDEKKKKASVIAGAIFKTDQLIKELKTLGKSTFETAITPIDEYCPNLRLYIGEDHDDP